MGRALTSSRLRAFALTTAELETLKARSADTATYGADEEDPEGLPDGEEGGDFPDGTEQAAAPGEEGEDDLAGDLPHRSNDTGLTQAAA